MKIKFGDFKFDAELISRTEEISKQSGRKLEVLDISFETGSKLKTPEFVYGDDKKWELFIPSYSYTEGSPITRYNWLIKEIEDLKIQTLIINSINFEPYLYKETIEKSSGDALLIDAVIIVEVEKWQEIKDLKLKDPFEYFPVIRQGISPEEVLMRFGRVLWSEYENKIKFRITLVEKNYDDYNHFVGFSEPELSNIKRILVESSKNYDNLLSLLSEKNLLTDEELEMSKSSYGEIDLLTFSKVKNLDKFLEETGDLEDLEKVDND